MDLLTEPMIRLFTQEYNETNIEKSEFTGSSNPYEEIAR